MCSILEDLENMEIDTQRAFPSRHLVAIRRDDDAFDIGTTVGPQLPIRRGLTLDEAVAFVAKGVRS